MLQRRYCVLPSGGAYCPDVSLFVTLAAIGAPSLDPLLYYQDDANAQPGLELLVDTVQVECPNSRSLCTAFEQRQAKVIVAPCSRSKLL